MKTKFKLFRIIASFLLVALLWEIICPTVAYALTGGPTQPEVSSFEPVGTSEMVDLSTGDFTYNIPLLDVEGYPINISYHGGVSMDQEASWVGLGWNINPGVINRNVRGLPDDFSGDEVIRDMKVKEDITVGGSLGTNIELFGYKKVKTKLSPNPDDPNNPIKTMDPRRFSLNLALGVYHNSYKGWGMDFSANPTVNVANKNGPWTVAPGLGLTASSQEGFEVSPEVGIGRKLGKGNNAENSIGGKVGLSVNSRQGLKQLTMSASYNRESTKHLDKTLKENTNKFGNFNAGVSGTIPLGSPTYVPQYSLPMTNFGFTFNGNVGWEITGAQPNINLVGYYSAQGLAVDRLNLPAYGYMYAEKSYGQSNALQDFNREKDGAYTVNMKRLPVTSQTFDIYAVSGQGIGTTLRPHRSDVGVVNDIEITNGGGSGKLGIDLGFGNVFKLGINLGLVLSESRSGQWTEGAGSEVTDRFKFRGNDISDPGYEPFYFKSAGEMATRETNIYNELKQDAPVAVAIEGTPLHAKAVGKIDVKDQVTVPVDGNNLFLKNRAKRTENITILNAAEAEKFAFDKIYSYPLAYWDNVNNSNFQPIEIPRLKKENVRAIDRKKHHTSEISVNKPDGSRYVYGIPAYNLHQQEASFNVGSNGSNGLVTYDVSDNSKNNEKGIDQYYSSNIQPAYAHSYLLTSVLSSDYQDVKGDGITDDDFGSAVKFNYHRAYPNNTGGGMSSYYGWRVPYNTNQANFDEGLKSKDKDQKGNIIYGTKEIWYTQSIESKNYVAVFSLSKREDGLGVIGNNGGKNVNAFLYKVDKISLYAKQDKILNGVKALPLKVVHFEYDYSLCPNVDNNTGTFVADPNNPSINLNQNKGKLTLKRIYFTYGNSTKGKLTSYRFYYADPDHDMVINPDYNPSYDIRGYDRWGNYKPSTGILNNAEFPYVDQDNPALKADKYAAVWSLSTIALPSGGVIKVDYEADDYGYVQDKRAMHMFKIENTYYKDANSNFNPGNGLLYESGGIFDGYNNYYYLGVRLSAPVSNNDELKRKYLSGISDLYFRCLLNLEPKEQPTDFVSGYAELDIDNCQIDPNDHTLAYIAVKPDGLRDNGEGSDVHPIAKAGWQFVKLNNPSLIFPGSEPASDGETAIRGLAGAFIENIPILLTGFNRTLRRRDFTNSLIPNKSFVRLVNPDYSKKGGGARVKKLVLNDSWNTMTTGGSAMEYGQSYEYKTKNEDGDLVSSGVAAYEPMIGNDENPFRVPIRYVNEKRLNTNENLYQEGPYGESFFPAPNVVYSRVKVTNTKPYGKEHYIKRTGTGFTIHEYYTAKDFPVKCDNTNINPHVYNPWVLPRFLYYVNDKKTTVAQGYSIETNDMHGKPKAVWSFAEDQSDFGINNATTALSGTEYIYRTKNNNGRELDNWVPVINTNGQPDATKALVGVDFDLVTDMRESTSETNGYDLMINTDGFVISIIPFVIPMIWPTISKDRTKFRSVVTTKVINKTGILEKIIYHDNGASTASVNEYWDKETGNVLVQKTYNEFNDSIYSFSYPAHWMYDGMGLAYKNNGIVLRNISFDSKGKIISATNIPSGKSIADYLYPGDIVGLAVGSNPMSDKLEHLGAGNNDFLGPFWVYKSNNKYFLIDREGYIYKKDPSIPFADLKIIRSGRKNMPSLPVGTLVNKNKLFNGSSLDVTNTINSGAIEYSDTWQTLCCSSRPQEDGKIVSYKDAICDVVNPFVKGIKGNWRVKRNFAFVGDRSFTVNPNIREDGKYLAFQPFWSYNNGSWAPATSNSKWQWATEVTKFSPFGYELENKDTLGRYSTALFGYNNTLNVALASNAKYNEIAFDGFEDYNYGKVNRTRPNVKKPNAYIIYPPHNAFESPFADFLTFIAKDTAHTGNRSLRINTGQSKSIERGLNITQPAISSTDTLYKLRLNDCIGQFQPNSVGKYVLSAWVKLKQPVESEYNASISVSIKRPAKADTVFVMTPSGEIIDGWQKIESNFYMPTGSSNIKISFNADPSNITYFDDLRIFPINSNMKSFVYDPTSLKLKATLDENNYATFYEYDEEGNLIRVKKETIKGVMTIQENRKHLKSNLN